MSGSTSSLFPNNSIASDLFVANLAGLGATIREIQHAAMAPAFLMPASMRSSLGIIANTNINTANASSLNSATITSSTITLTGGAVTSLAAEGSTNVYLEGASSNNAFVIKAGLFAEKGSTEYSTVLGNGGYSIVESGGNASGTDIGSGGAQFVYSGGTATGTVINTSGTQIIASGGTANTIYIDGKGAAEIVQAGGTDSGAIAILGGIENVFGLSKNAVIGNNGLLLRNLEVR